MIDPAFQYDVFLSHSAKDKAVVRPLAERLRADGLKVWFDEWVLKPGDSIPAKTEEGLEHSRVLVLCMSANAFGSDWTQLEAGTFRFRDPLNRERRFVPLRLDDAPIKGSLAQFLYINHLSPDREQEYAKLLTACRSSPVPENSRREKTRDRCLEETFSLGHTSFVNCMAWSPDDRFLVSGAEDRTVRLWQVASGRCLRVLEGHTEDVRCVAWSPDGQRVLSGANDETVRLWDVESGRCLRVLQGHTEHVLSVAWSPDGKHALSAAGDRAVRLWEVESGLCQRVFQGHTERVCSVAWKPDGSKAVSGAADKTVRFWDIESSRCLRVLEGHTDIIRSVAWSPDGRHTISGADDQTVRLWEVPSGNCVRVLKGHRGCCVGLAWGPDGRHVFSGADDNSIRIWSARSGKCLRVLRELGESAKEYDLEDECMAAAQSALSIMSARVRCVAWSHDGLRAVSSARSTLRLWEIRSGRCALVLPGHWDHIWNMAWSRDGWRALSGSGDTAARLWEVESGRCLHVLESHSGQVQCLAWSPERERVFSGAEDHTVRVWDAKSGHCLSVLEGHTGPVRCVSCSPDGSRALSAADDRTLRLWEIDSGRCLRVLDSHSDEVLSVAWSPDGSRALSGSCDKTVRLWEVESGRCLRVLRGHTGRVWCVAWSPDGSRALSGASDNTVRLWKVESGGCLQVMEGHTGNIRTLAWSPNGEHALSGADDQTLRLWGTESGRCLRVLEGHSGAVLSAAWSPDGWNALSGASNGVARLWNLTTWSSPLFPSGKTTKPGAAAEIAVQYANAKVLVVGDSGVGKTALSNYLAHRIKVKDNKPLPATDGAWATHWPLRNEKEKAGAEREIWLWDFAGQVDYRLVHQLFMDDTAAAVLVFDPQNENPFEGLGRWDRDLQKAARKPFAKLLAAARIDRGSLVVSAATIKKFMAERGFLGSLHETSAKTGTGCDELGQAIVGAIDWNSIPETTSPALYHRMKQEILRLRDSGVVLIRLGELKQRMEMTLRGENFELAELEAVVGLLTGPGMIQRLDFGGFILLRPEVLSRYAAAVVRKVRNQPQELGCIREDELLAGDLDYQDFKRLPREDEAVVLRALHETFVSRAWCLRQHCDGSAMLTFPSYFRRERKEQPSHPSVVVSYRFDGPADEIYATLVVRLQHTVAFESTEFWKSAADFRTQTGTKLGFTLTREAEGSSRLEVYFEPDVDANSRVLFLRYVHDHLMQRAQNVARLRRYFCGNRKCDAFGQAFGDQARIAKALAPGGKGRLFCPDCGKPILLRDVIEEEFDSPAVKEQVRKMENEGQAMIDNESRELLAVHHTGFIVAEAGQIFRGYTNSDHGIDGEIEFKDDQGRASGKRLYVQLKSGDSYLVKRQRDGAEVFQIKSPRWADYWQRQAYAVMLVIRTSDGEIRWMDVSAHLKRESVGGKPARHVVFAGERFDVMSVRRWRERVLGGG